MARDLRSPIWPRPKLSTNCHIADVDVTRLGRTMTAEKDPFPKAPKAPTGSAPLAPHGANGAPLESRGGTAMTMTPTLSAPGRESIVLTVGPASADHFVSLVETFGEATRSACRSLVLDLSEVDRIDSDLLGL